MDMLTGFQIAKSQDVGKINGLLICSANYIIYILQNLPADHNYWVISLFFFLNLFNQRVPRSNNSPK